jgi:hypothetical protein
MIGKRVKLKNTAANALMRRPKNRIDWLARRGTVMRSTRGLLSVQWDDRTSTDDGLPAIGFEECGS